MEAKQFYELRNKELNRLRGIRYHGYESTLKEIGVSYIGGVNVSSKIAKNEKVNVLTYCIYLAAADNAYGLEVCNKQTSRACRSVCLVKSGRQKIDFLSSKHSVQSARNKRTMLYFANRELFCKIIEVEILRAQREAKRNGYIFSIRLNCTSDLPLTSLNKFEGGLNIFERFPNVQFYDYSKRPLNLRISKQYKNYHVVLSYFKGNESLCREWLRNGGSIAVVFGTFHPENFPKTFLGYPVINGDLYDARFLDPKNVVVGLKYKVGSQDFKRVNGHYVFTDIPKNDLVVPV